MMVLRRVVLGSLLIVVAAFSTWCAAALAIDGPATGRAATMLGVVWLVGLAAIGFSLRSIRRAVVVVLVLDLAFTGWWLSIRPSNDRRWIPDVERLASVERDGDRVRFRNVRNFDYHSSDTDFTADWEERVFDLSEVRAVDIFFSEWGAPMIAHTIMSWEFADGRHLAISIETRKEVGEEYSAVLGFFRQFELYYVVADERDVIRVRTDFRGETVRVYRLSASPENARRLLEDYVESIDELDTEPAWYNALTQNCTTSIWRHVHKLDSDFGWDWRILANGSADALLYMRGSIENSLPFEELRRVSDVTGKAREAGTAEDFSWRIRQGLPRMKAAN